MRGLAAVLLSLALSVGSFSQTASPPTPVSDAKAVSLAQQAISALRGGGSVSDVTLSANVIFVLGSDYETGSGTFQVKGASEARVNLNLNGGTRSFVRSNPNGIPIGAWTNNTGSITAYSQHNCWTDAPWFFPALASLLQTANPRFVFKYVGAETRNGVPVQHVQAFQTAKDDAILQRLSTMDFYLNSTSGLPVALAFNSHADDNMNTDVPTEVDFASYQSVNGIMVPFHFQQILDGVVVLDATVTSATFNTGLQDSLFSLQ